MCFDSSVTSGLLMHAQVSIPGSYSADAHLRSRLRTARHLRTPLLLVAVVAFLLLTVGCGEKKRTTRSVPPPPTIGAPEKTPTETAKPAPPESGNAEKEDAADAFAAYENNAPIWTEVGYASWYGPPYHNRRGANGEIYNQNAMTAAHRSLPMNSIVRVTNLKTGHQQIVRITDRGPFVEDRIVDLSAAAAKAVDVWRPGTAKVKLEVLYAPADIESGGRWCVQIGAFSRQKDALELKEKLMKRYHTAKVLQFPGPTGFWVRVRVLDDDKKRAQEVAKVINVDEGGVFLVRLD
jgi:rare lipoprotein A